MVRAVNPFYRLGLRIVLATVSAAAVLSFFVPPPRGVRAANQLESVFPPLPGFTLTERSGREITDGDLASRVWIGSFVFTRCQASCPRITSVMKGLQEKLADKPVQLVSFSVDPEHDTPQVLAEYARGYQADPDRWWFLTGSKDGIYRLIKEGFKLPVEPLDPDDPQALIMDISHSNKLALVDTGNRIVGLYDSESQDELRALIERAERLEKPWVAKLPAVNASLNAVCTTLLVLALTAVRNGRVRAHITLMISALVVSAVFLACYLVYHAQIGGGVSFQGRGGIRFVYFTVLISHVVLAAAVVPLVLITVSRAIRKRFDAHIRIARITFPIWLYVSITGVVVYLMLYQLDVGIGPVGLN